MDMSPIRLQKRDNRLTTEYIPANDAAVLACAIAGTRYMNPHTIAILKQYNIHVIVDGTPERVL